MSTDDMCLVSHHELGMEDFPSSPIFVPRDPGADAGRSSYSGSDPGGHDGFVVVPIMNDGGFRVEVFDAEDVGRGPIATIAEPGHDRAVRAALRVDAPGGVVERTAPEFASPTNSTGSTSSRMTWLTWPERSLASSTRAWR